MIIQVTSEHIRKGKRGDYYKCSVAMALHDATELKWSVGLWGCRLRNVNAIGFIPLSKQVKRKIKAIDANKLVKPFRFRIKQETLDAHQGITR